MLLGGHVPPSHSLSRTYPATSLPSPPFVLLSHLKAPTCGSQYLLDTIHTASSIVTHMEISRGHQLTVKQCFKNSSSFFKVIILILYVFKHTA